MNKVHFNLKQTKDRDALSQIMVLTTVNGRRIRVYTKQRVCPAEWDNQLQCCAIANGVQWNSERTSEHAVAATLHPGLHGEHFAQLHGDAQGEE